MQISVRVELHEKCMTSIFPYTKNVCVAFLVNPRAKHTERGYLELRGES